MCGSLHVASPHLQQCDRMWKSDLNKGLVCLPRNLSLVWGATEEGGSLSLRWRLGVKWGSSRESFFWPWFRALAVLKPNRPASPLIVVLVRLEALSPRRRRRSLCSLGDVCLFLSGPWQGFLFRSLKYSFLLIWGGGDTVIGCSTYICIHCLCLTRN